METYFLKTVFKSWKNKKINWLKTGRCWKTKRKKYIDNSFLIDFVIIKKLALYLLGFIKLQIKMKKQNKHIMFTTIECILKGIFSGHNC